MAARVGDNVKGLQGQVLGAGEVYGQTGQKTKWHKSAAFWRHAYFGGSVLYLIWFTHTVNRVGRQN